MRFQSFSPSFPRQYARIVQIQQSGRFIEKFRAVFGAKLLTFGIGMCKSVELFGFRVSTMGLELWSIEDKSFGEKQTEKLNIKRQIHKDMKDGI